MHSGILARAECGGLFLGCFVCSGLGCGVGCVCERLGKSGKVRRKAFQVGVAQHFSQATASDEALDGLSLRCLDG